MRIKNKLLSGNIAGPIFDKRGNFAKQTKSLEENRTFIKNLKFSIKSSTVWRLLTSAGLPTK